MIIAAAQFQSRPGDVDLNIKRHVQFAEVAKRYEADLIVFPELSLSGYEPSMGRRVEAEINDKCFEPIQACAQKLAIIICAGIPLKTATKPKIGMIICYPGDRVDSYAKQILHGDELPFFSAGHRDLMITCGDQSVAPAICYESVQSVHAEAASRRGAGTYIASVAKPEGAMRSAFVHYSKMAKQTGMQIILANAVGRSDNFVSAGQSAAWNSAGECIRICSRTDEALLIANFADETAQIVRGPASS